MVCLCVLMLLVGLMGVGKLFFVKCVYELKCGWYWFVGLFIEINCVMLCGDVVMLMLFGYVKGVFIGV